MSQVGWRSWAEIFLGQGLSQVPANGRAGFWSHDLIKTIHICRLGLSTLDFVKNRPFFVFKVDSILKDYKNLDNAQKPGKLTQKRAQKSVFLVFLAPNKGVMEVLPFWEISGLFC